MNLIVKIDPNPKNLESFDYRQFEYKPHYIQMPLFDTEEYRSVPQTKSPIYSKYWKSIDDKERTQLAKSGLRFLEDIGILSLNKEQKIGFHGKCISLEKKISITLGFLAEGLMVRECHYNKEINKKLFSIAARCDGIDSDEYIAVGTNFNLTKETPKMTGVYNPNSQRDIIWIKKDSCSDFYKDGHHIGIQVKTTSQHQAISLSNLNHYYPILYFDLGRNFELTMNRFYQSKVKNKKDYTFIKAENIVPRIHNDLLSYKEILKRIFENNINLKDLDPMTVAILDHAFTLDLVHDKPSHRNEIIIEIADDLQ